ncbi:MAG: hypothetical protein LBV43_11750 [Prevotella sp.]|jgi:hypothetical protein|nr:hypothetical protein [Prevotella sp.]
MKKHIFLITLFIIITLSAKSQFSVSYSAGYGSYEMGDMKNLLNNMANELGGQLPGIPVKVVDNFPGYVTHNLDLSYRIKRHEFGFRSTYMTTGGKIGYSDYTGEYSGKLTLNGYRIGLNYRYYVPVADFGKSGLLSFFAELSPGITFSNLKSKEYIYLNILEERQDTDDNIDMNANGVSLLPQIGVKWFLTPNIGIHVSGGYDFQLGSYFKYQGVKSNIKSDWSGLRINGGVSFSW